MRFRLWHLLLLFPILAIALVASDRFFRSTAVVVFSDAKLALDLNDKPVGYSISFSVEGSIEGSAADKLGYSRMFKTDISQSNFTQLNGREVLVTYREHQLPWLPEISIAHAINSRFHYEILWRD